MITQPELFQRTTGFKPSESLEEPRIWVRELRVYRVFAPGTSNLLRRIPLRRGLNILWARPRRRLPEGQGYAGGVSGHGTGKTTFCRFIRHLLGEGSFGNDEQRARLREAFPDGWIVGEVRLAGTPWIVCRPFKIGLASYVYRGRTIETLFDGDEGRESFRAFESELTRLLAEPLPVTTFATTPAPIEWPHLLQWLTRDQECRFSGLAELRHTDSDSHAPDMVAEDRHFLFRAVLGLIDTAEQAELENNKTYLKQKNDAEKNAPLLRFRGDSVYERLRATMPDFRADLTGSDFLQAVADEWTSQAKASEAQLKAFTPSAALKQARTNLVIARSALETAEKREYAIRGHLLALDQQVRQLSHTPSADADAALAAWFKEREADTDAMCGHTLAAAIEHECPLATGRKLPVEKTAVTLDTAATIERVTAQKAEVAAQLDAVRRMITSRENAVAKADEALSKETAADDGLRAKLSRKLAEEEGIIAEATRSYADRLESEKLTASIAESEAKIHHSQTVQSVLREKNAAVLSAFSETFGRVARAILEHDEVKSEIRFRGRKIQPALKDDIDLTSAALETLKIICFDLAALVSGVEGRGWHPLFHLHDGPREADMDASLYRNIFHLIRSLEQAYGEKPPAFQYIITTTEAPPEELLQAPWLLVPTLDASEPGGKLLGENF